MIVSETEDTGYITDEVKRLASQSMERLQIGNLQYIRAQQKVRKLNEQLRSIPEVVEGNEEVRFAMAQF